MQQNTIDVMISDLLKYGSTMSVIKRDGQEMPYDAYKIVKAIRAANDSCEDETDRMSEMQIFTIAEDVTRKFRNSQHTPTIEEIQENVINGIMRQGAFEVAKRYTEYRYKRALARKSNTTDDSILSLIDYANEEVKQENSNKNPQIASTQRDYMAGEVSKDITMRILLPPDVVEAHEEGIIHFHDADYFAQRIYNCCLVNMNDVLQNGTVITDTMIETPKSFTTASNITTQVIAQTASNQYGGQTFSLAHLAPFVDVSRQKWKERIKRDGDAIGKSYSDEEIANLAELRVKDEIKAGVQMIQYQLLTLMTTNGQTPFVSMFIYLDEAPAGRTRDDLALMVEEVLNQRIKGIKNEKGVYVTPAFPKILYVLDEDNIHEDSRYYYLTELAARCTAKRLVPDYISAKIMREMKHGDTYPCMGCVDGKEVIAYRYNGNLYAESFERMWDRLSKYFEVGLQPNGYDYVMKTPGVQIYDQKAGFVDNYGVIKNHNNEWLRISFSNGRIITCTKDHPFETTDGRVVLAENLVETDLIDVDKTSNFICDKEYDMRLNRAWMQGLAVCDSTYYDHFTVSIAQTGEDEIETAFKDVIHNEYGLNVAVDDKHRGKKGSYKDLIVESDGTDAFIKLRIELISAFGGKAKVNRHIPNETFSWSYEARLAFIAGMIDADGYLNTSSKKAIVQIGSTNKELAIQQALLIQTCGMFARIYPNRYRANCREKIRYRIEFMPTAELLNYVKCNKKTELYDSVLKNTNASILSENTCHITNVETFIKDGFSYDVTTASEHFTVSGIYSHNCRSFLTPDRFTDAGLGNIANAKDYKDGEHKYYGRFNQGVVTINLVDVACSSGRDMNKFWRILDDRLSLCHKALRCRHDRLKGTPSDIAPILFQHGVIARLEKGETIDKLLYNGYSTISLGYAGLYEMCVYMTGKSHTDPEAKPFALAVMQKLNDACEEWKKTENIDYSVYGTPLESTTYKFAKSLQNRFGIIKGVTDHNYITNSYHQMKVA